MKIGEYDYKKLLKRATASNSTAEDRLNLWYWFERYGMQFWNGECFDLVWNGDLLYPVYEHEYDEDGDIFQSKVVDCEIRR